MDESEFLTELNRYPVIRQWDWQGTTQEINNSSTNSTKSQQPALLSSSSSSPRIFSSSAQFLDSLETFLCSYYSPQKSRLIANNFELQERHWISSLNLENIEQICKDIVERIGESSMNTTIGNNKTSIDMAD